MRPWALVPLVKSGVLIRVCPRMVYNEDINNMVNNTVSNKCSCLCSGGEGVWIGLGLAQ